MELKYHFETETFKLAWQDWKNYRKVIKRKPIKDEQRALNHIFRISKGVEQIAVMIMGLSMDNEYQGLFPLPSNMRISIPVQSKISQSLSSAQKADDLIDKMYGSN